MSRAFVKEDNSGEPPIIPPRAPLPPGTPNYVTPQGLAQLRAELAALEAERAKAEADREEEAERTRRLTVLHAQLQALNQRLASARVIDPQAQPTDEVRFGATVTLCTISGSRPGKVQQFTIVGVDEASVADGKVAFLAPIARAVTGLRVGQTVKLRIGRVDEVLEVVAVQYGTT
ncbi:GreA/GreB family elongation factor [Pontibacter russatus]|uniref:GreA/GreB family elongation factor n=1 Tax=Pontibacter russatus TaxID=2694929 RepID=UPI00137A747D|nr:GreA/GreB family elongation factor [Pontibacter russatus]